MPTLHDRPTARQVRAAVDAADVMDLLYALIEPDHENGLPIMDEDYVHCPICQASPSQWVLSGPAAMFGGDLTWCCFRCGAQGTRWGLIRQVLESPAALSRFLQHLPAAA